MTVRVEHGDSRDVTRTLADASIDSCVCDPPYALVSIVKRFGKTSMGDDTKTSARSRGGADGYARAARGFMGKQWDTGETAFDPEFWADVLRVMKPGAHLVAFGGTRSYHRLACAIEDAGFEIRDQIGWLYGSGFPKSHDVSKGIDRTAGAEREIVGPASHIHSRGEATSFPKRPAEKTAAESGRLAEQTAERAMLTAPATDAARQWQGWGTALKPAWEPIVLARKPLQGTVAANVLAHGTGALNIDGCRVESGGEHMRGVVTTGQTRNTFGKQAPKLVATDHPAGRWPANVIHDGSEEVLAAFPDAKAGGNIQSSAPSDKTGTVFGKFTGRFDNTSYQDAGNAARFFYSAKADADDRLGSKHPTVKPVDLMAYLCRLVTPPSGTVLDPFAGSGTTGMACLREGFDCILIEREREYYEDILRRLDHVRGADTPLFESAR